MERTISAMIGKGSVNHNTRAFTAKNVDKNRSADNVEFCQEDIKQVYHKLFDEALERYNAKQKRKDRMIDDYYEKIRRGKQEKLFHEVIFQIGNKDDMNAKSEDGLLAKRILMEFMDEFQARNPNLYVFSAHLHAALAKIYYDIRLKEFVWEKEVCMDDFKKSTEGERILAGLVDGAIAGFISVWEPDLFVHNLFVCKQYRRTGLGAALIAEANRKYGSPLSLKCMKDNKNALTFYEKNGWKIRESGMCEEGEYYFMVQDAVENKRKERISFKTGRISDDSGTWCELCGRR